MTRSSILSLAASVAIAASVGAGCGPQTPATNNTAATDHSGHDMSKMDNHNSSNAGGHDMSNMRSAPNASEQPFDLQFIDTMIHHHDGALEMAKGIIATTKRAELKTFAQKIIDDQTKEIATLKGWRDQWFAGKPSALNMEMPGMMDSMKKEMSKLSSSKGNAFDQATNEKIITHHNEADTMAKEAMISDVGMPRMPYFGGVCGFSSMLSLATLILP